jgi:endonuclease YncB( thermonuclease family)
MHAIILLVLVLAGLPAWAAAAEDPTTGLVLDAVVRVTEIVDGDTVVLADGRQVRLVGIQAPKAITPASRVANSIGERVMTVPPVLYRTPSAHLGIVPK